MQVFVPTTDLYFNANCLDWRRRNKQIIECRQIGLAITNPNYGWQNHPAVSMWRGHLPFLMLAAHFFNRAYFATSSRNHKAWENMQADHPHILVSDLLLDQSPLPSWWGDDRIHDSHASRLIQKDPDFYKDKFPWITDHEMEYVWLTHGQGGWR